MLVESQGVEDKLANEGVFHTENCCVKEWRLFFRDKNDKGRLTLTDYRRQVDVSEKRTLSNTMRYRG